MKARGRRAAEGHPRSTATSRSSRSTSTATPYSSIFDSALTRVHRQDTSCKVLSWYDNEWGFSNRMRDVALLRRAEALIAAVVRTLDGSRRRAASASSSASTSTCRSTAGAIARRDAHRGDAADAPAGSSSTAGAPILASHLGRPKGEADREVLAASPSPRTSATLLGARRAARARLRRRRGRARSSAALQHGDVVLLENLRFHAGGGEERPELRAAQLARARRRLRERRVRRRAPRARVDRTAW